VPLAGVSLFIGLSMLSVTMLRSAGFTLAWADSVRLRSFVLHGMQRSQSGDSPSLEQHPNDREMGMHDWLRMCITKW
jgi:hypothetical protein